jgi:NAD(P)-dependent dehydrogenase (short-subunit alcohol dehydrogenase family)
VTCMQRVQRKEPTLGGEFDDKVGIVTGAGGVINRVILTRLTGQGARCVLVDINDDWGESAVPPCVAAISMSCTSGATSATASR